MEAETVVPNAVPTTTKNSKGASRQEERARQLILSYDLPPERLGRLLEEKELQQETELISKRAKEIFHNIKYLLRFHQPEDDEYGYALNQFTAYITFGEGTTYSDVGSYDLTPLKFLTVD